MKKSLVAVILMLVHFSVHGQEDIGPEIEPVRLSTSDEETMQPVQQLRTFYGLSRGLVDFMQTSRISGRGWKFPRAGRKQVRQKVEEFLEKRKEFLAEAESLDELTQDFWSKVIDQEIANEKEMCLVLDELLGPNEQKAFFIENSKELSAAVLYSPLFARLGKLTEKQQISQIDKLNEELRTRSRIVGGSKVAVFNRVNWLGGLSPKQLEVMLVLQARMDDDMTLAEYLDTVSPRELEFFANSNESVRILLASMNDSE